MCDDRLERLTRKLVDSQHESGRLIYDLSAAWTSELAQAQEAQVRARAAEERVKALEGEVDRLNQNVAEWSRQNLKIIAMEVEQRKRAELAEAQVMDLKAKLASTRVMALEEAARVAEGEGRPEIAPAIRDLNASRPMNVIDQVT